MGARGRGRRPPAPGGTDAPPARGGEVTVMTSETGYARGAFPRMGVGRQTPALTDSARPTRRAGYPLCYDHAVRTPRRRDERVSGLAHASGAADGGKGKRMATAVEQLPVTRPEATNGHVEPNGALIAVAETAAEAEVVTVAAAVEMFFGDLRLAPRSKKTYRHGIAKFLRHLEQHEGIAPDAAPVTAIVPDHVTSFAALLVPPDVRTPEEVSQMRTAQNNLSAVRKFCAYLAA